MGRKDMSEALTATGLAIGHGRTAVMRGIDLHVSPGELTALVGVNGVGKSTLLRTLAGLLPPLEGRVAWGKDDVHALSARERAKAIAVVLTGRPRTGMLTVEALVGLGRHPWTGRWGTIGEADRNAVEQALQRTGAQALRHRFVEACSDGECQKVLIARALAQDTPVLLLDEPTAFLDLPNRAEIVRMLRAEAHAAGKAVLFSTHDLQLALDLCDKLVLLRSGKAPWQGTPREAMASGELARAFEGSGIRFDAEHGTHRFMA
jgi:iron complex transport system ATP-binding protein